MNLATFWIVQGLIIIRDFHRELETQQKFNYSDTNCREADEYFRLERFGGIEERKGIGEVACVTSVLRWSKCTIDFDSPSTLASLQHIRFQGELFLLARARFSQLWHDVLEFRTWTIVFTYFGVSNTFRLDMLRTDVLDVMILRFWG
ncbi:uncharacterized protein LOC125857822 [Solanum stenotomum]|uniref:uncharacterized protein LOC125857822 n=1 Tax=Solanum stenotomum TaxID=172797 RepID=UPI0020D046EE|nr:uncharacterized protein LOC125857822 [Solanum stenotomum]